MSEATPRNSDRRFRLVSICADGERLVYATGLDIVQAYERRRLVLSVSDRFVPALVIEPDEPGVPVSE